MMYHLVWILFLVLPQLLTSQQTNNEGPPSEKLDPPQIYDTVKPEGNPGSEQIISVRITSSVAVGRGKGKPHKHHVLRNQHAPDVNHNLGTTVPQNLNYTVPAPVINDKVTTTTPTELTGANEDFIRQLTEKKKAKSFADHLYQYPSEDRELYNRTEDSIAEPSLRYDTSDSEGESVPLARSISQSPISKNYIQGLRHKPKSERVNSPRLTTVSFNIVHDTPKITDSYNEPTKVNPSQVFNPQTQYYDPSSKSYSQPAQIYSEPAKFYSEAAKVYSEAAKVYSEASKVYSEPAKVYSEPAKVYSEPAKVYSEPAKFYSQPASLHLTPDDTKSIPQTSIPWHQQSSGFAITTSIGNTTPLTTITNPSYLARTQRIHEHQPEKNYEVDEKISVLTDGRSHGIQPSNVYVGGNHGAQPPVGVLTNTEIRGQQNTIEANDGSYRTPPPTSTVDGRFLKDPTPGFGNRNRGRPEESNSENCQQDNCKVGYVVEGRQYRKYRVEERTPEGFIVGEYGVVSNEDGAPLRGVRYTADRAASPSLIQDALMKFLQLT